MRAPGAHVAGDTYIQIAYIMCPNIFLYMHTPCLVRGWFDFSKYFAARSILCNPAGRSAAIQREAPVRVSRLIRPVLRARYPPPEFSQSRKPSELIGLFCFWRRR